MRINARLDPELSQKLRHLEAQTGQSASEVIRHALHLYYTQVVTPTPSAWEIFNEQGFVGSAAGATELASDYKHLLNFDAKAPER
ncbi:MAG: ribbon-helix-helix protein, CopG family [Candidatus Sericytochromatia bacterium]